MKTKITQHTYIQQYIVGIQNNKDFENFKGVMLADFVEKVCRDFSINPENFLYDDEQKAIIDDLWDNSRESLIKITVDNILSKFNNNISINNYLMFAGYVYNNHSQLKIQQISFQEFILSHLQDVNEINVMFDSVNFKELCPNLYYKINELKEIFKSENKHIINFEDQGVDYLNFQLIENKTIPNDFQNIVESNESVFETDNEVIIYFKGYKQKDNQWLFKCSEENNYDFTLTVYKISNNVLVINKSDNVDFNINGLSEHLFVSELINTLK